VRINFFRRGVTWMSDVHVCMYIQAGKHASLAYRRVWGHTLSET